MSTQKKNRKLVLHPEGNIIADSGRYALVEFYDFFLEADGQVFTDTGTEDVPDRGFEVTEHGVRELTEDEILTMKQEEDWVRKNRTSLLQKFIQWVKTLFTNKKGN